MGVIRPSTSPWASPVVIVPKKDGGIRFRIDYRKLNKVAKFDAYPMPWSHQEDGKGKIHFCPRPRPWILANSKLWGFNGKDSIRNAIRIIRVCRYAIWITQRTSNLHEDDESSTKWISILCWSRLRWYPSFQWGLGWSLNAFEKSIYPFERCQFVVEEFKVQTWLHSNATPGSRDWRGQDSPRSQKVEAVKNYKQPETKSEVRDFLGLTGYYRRFILNYSNTEAPLTVLTQKVKPETVQWNQENHKASEKLKNALISGLF